MNFQQLKIKFNQLIEKTKIIIKAIPTNQWIAIAAMVIGLILIIISILIWP